jgi:LPS export ABC transporter protein LptC/lipopolysaccharide transport protein LptA
MLKIKNKIFYRYMIPILMLGIVIEILIIAPAKIENSKDLSIDTGAPTVTSASKEQVMLGVHLTETHESGKDWELWAEKAYSSREDGSWVIEKVKIRIFGQQDGSSQKNIYYDVTGDKGQIDPKRKNIIIDGGEGEVQTVTSNGYLLKTKKIFYDTEIKQLKSESEIKMFGPQIKGESRLELTGMGMVTDLKTNQLHILESIKAKKTLQKGQLVTVSSDDAIFNSANYSAFFNKNVMADYGPYRVTGQVATLEVDPKLHTVDTITVQGQVKLSDISRWAVADKVKIYAEQRKMVLSGAPRLIQNNNELSGEEITFFEEGSQIQVKKAKAKFDKETKGL